MKRIEIILLIPLYIAWMVFACCTLFSQERSAYFNFSFDPNKATGIIDNPRTKVDHRGLDFDFEAGVKGNFGDQRNPINFGMFIFYGRFQDAGYQNYGIGASYYLPVQYVDWSIGAAFGSVLKIADYYEEPTWMNFLAWNLRSVVTYYFLPNFGITVTGQFQQRPDIQQLGIFEFKTGITYTLTL